MVPPRQSTGNSRGVSPPPTDGCRAPIATRHVTGPLNRARLRRPPPGSPPVPTSGSGRASLPPGPRSAALGRSPLLPSITDHNGWAGRRTDGDPRPQGDHSWARLGGWRQRRPAVDGNLIAFGLGVKPQGPHPGGHQGEVVPLARGPLGGAGQRLNGGHGAPAPELR